MSSSHLPPLRLLSLDGGGVRGLSSLLILQDIMTNISTAEKQLHQRSPTDTRQLKPCDYFDLIGGTSTGGIIAILLSRLRLDVPTCIKIYTSLAERVFKNDRSVSVFGMKLRAARTRFSGAVLEGAIKDVLKEYGFDPEERMYDETLPQREEIVAAGGRVSTGNLQKLEVVEGGRVKEVVEVKKTKNRNRAPSSSPKRSLKGRKSTGLAFPQQPEPIIPKIIESDASSSSTEEEEGEEPTPAGCHGLVVAVYKHAVGVPKLFLTSDPNDRTKIWQALRATSAAPTFFEEISFGSPKITYIDGGLGYNSPCVEIDNQAKSLWEGRSIGCIVSIGTGLQTIPGVQNNSSWLPSFGLRDDLSLAGAIVQMATSTTRVDNEVQRMYRGTETEYYRWDVDTGLADISLEQWMREDEMASASRRYMEDPDQKIRCRKLANTLARLSAGPKVIECSAGHFTVGLRPDDNNNGGLAARDPENPAAPSWLMENLDMQTGYPPSMAPPVAEEENKRMPAVDSPTAIPVKIDLDGDGHRAEAQVITCVRAEHACLRTLITHVPQGRYSVRFVVCLHGKQQDPTSPPRVAADVSPPVNLILSAGRPYDSRKFARRYVDPVISADIGAVVLQPDALRVRIDEELWRAKEGKGWFEVRGDGEVSVGLEGEVGIVMNKVFESERRWIGGWSFGGVRLVPVRGGM